MFSILVNALSNFFFLAVASITVQNVLLVKGLGFSRLLSLVENHRTTAIVGTQLVLVTSLAGSFNFLLNYYVIPAEGFPDYLRPLVMVLCTALSFVFVFILTIKFYPEDMIKEATATLPLASFNCVVIATLQYETLAKLTMLGSFGYSVGSALGYVAAIFLVSEGGKKLHSPSMPKAFRGLPAVLLYIAGLVLAMYGLTGALQ